MCVLIVWRTLMLFSSQSLELLILQSWNYGPIAQLPIFPPHYPLCCLWAWSLWGSHGWNQIILVFLLTGLFPLSTLSSRFLRIVAVSGSPSFSPEGSRSPLCACATFCLPTHLSVDTWGAPCFSSWLVLRWHGCTDSSLGPCFQVLGCMSCGIAGWYDSVSFLGFPHAVFHSTCTILHSHRQSTRVPTSP